MQRVSVQGENQRGAAAPVGIAGQGRDGHPLGLSDRDGVDRGPGVALLKPVASRILPVVGPVGQREHPVRRRADQREPLGRVGGARFAGCTGDERIPDSFSLAQQAGLDYTIGTVVLRGAHPNTALLRLEGVSGRKLGVMGASLGGGGRTTACRINICQIDGITTNFGGDHNTLIVHNQDTPGHVAEVTTALAQRGINIATMQLYRSTAGGYAVMVLECDQPLPDALIAELRGMQGIVKVTGLNLAQQTETKEGA